LGDRIAKFLKKGGSGRGRPGAAEKAPEVPKAVHPDVAIYSLRRGEGKRELPSCTGL
jgi:hypothetical protein